MDHIKEWMPLLCPDCHYDQFLARTRLLIKPGSGIQQDVTGWQCGKCGMVADLTKMQRDLTLTEKRRELAALEEELGLTTAAKGATPGLTSSLRS